MKRLTALTLILMMAFALLPARASQPGLAIVTLNFPAFDFSRQVAGPHAQVSLLLPPGVDAHSFEPSPRDLIALQQADLLVYNGGIGEHWVVNLLDSLGEDAPRALAMMDLVDTVSEELVEGMEDVPHAHAWDEHEDEHGEDGHEDEHGEDGHGDHDEERELDEHVWTDPRNAILISLAIAEALSELDPANADDYEAAFLAYEAQLLALDQAFREMVSEASRRTIVLGDRFPMRYFTLAYGLEYYAAFPGCSAQTEPSARTIAFLMDTIKEQQIPTVFHIEFSSQKASRLIAQETGASTLLLHSVHNVSQDELDAGATYISLMYDNLKNLKEALN